MRTFGFTERLNSTFGTRRESHLLTIKDMLLGCETIRDATREENIKGIDFVATLRRGAEVYIDTKERENGCSNFWKSGPELALETWSKMPVPGRSAGKAGWTLDESKQTDYILFLWDKRDCGEALLVPFQLLRIAFRKHYEEWTTKYWKATQKTIEQGSVWHSECVFVPAHIVLTAVDAAQHGERQVVQVGFTF